MNIARVAHEQNHWWPFVGLKGMDWGTNPRCPQKPHGHLARVGPTPGFSTECCNSFLLVSPLIGTNGCGCSMCHKRRKLPQGWQARATPLSARLTPSCWLIW